ncbi:MAG: TonB-dependent receptor [Sphingomonas sp.]|uniref:TonB-dependent receptor n=1 Tax=Sphingomonas sp. TaxID=28214 RepID=UPI001AFF5C40|nr:TonB-dependent receptor [Sphingomonas sp.]MBO9621691.1 TonB-dependent receptor [Sphingomonas sp.]
MIRTLAAALATTTCMVALATPAAAQTREFNVPAGSLRTALDTFARQSGRQVIYRDDVRSARSPGVRGAHTAEDALNAILAGTGFVARIDRSGALAIVKAGNAPTAPGDAASLGEDVTSSSEIVVVGTNIRGLTNPTVPVAVYGREEIERSGYANTQDFITSLPQNFKGGETGASQDSVINSSAGLANVESASGVNLRGLGNSSSLVLLNGHRIAPSAYGAAVDVSQIPLDAIERIEVLTDGASALYGSDAVGGVVNFSLQRDYDGLETSARVATDDDGRLEHKFGGTLGRNWTGGGALLSLQYQHADRLSTRDRSFTHDAVQPTDLLPKRDQYSAILSANQRVGSEFSLNLDGLFSRTEQSRSYSTTRGTDQNNSKSDFLSLAGGLSWRPQNSTWRVDATGVYSKVSTVVRQPVSRTAGYPLGSIYIENGFKLAEVDLKANGTLGSLGSGDIRIALGASHRAESFASELPWRPANNRNFSRRIESAFAELYVPLIDSEAGVPFIRRLDLSGAIRFDHYSDVGNTTNPRVGISWQPFADLNLRAGWGTSFRAPNASETVLNAANRTVLALDGFDAPGGGTAPVLFLTSSTQLRPEKARSLTLGAEYHPHFATGFRAAINYFSIRYRDRLITPPFDVGILVNPDTYGPLVVQFGNESETSAFLDDLLNGGFQFFDLTGQGTSSIRYAYFGGLTNASLVRESGFDASISNSFPVGADRLLVNINATIINHLLSSFCAGCTPTRLDNRYGQILDFRMRSTIGWISRDWQINGAVNYANDYLDTTVTPNRKISAFTTLDVNFGLSPSSWRGLDLRLSVNNLLDTRPPRTGSAFQPGIAYDAANADPLGRVFAITLRKSW